ncbi:hypothetical protein Pcac1_g22567 [Phytophthora cactorum]|uniref:Uncharacterized protein n=1 Tax=Phytophthora cactorum TaxID=29920 RepID=A0A8T1AVL3_9STRA|nr:hypothetical protein Pcac1_g22567 [Phytophthora cactorum]KAG2801144.1 hypothetical protein PC112_g20164 [Phytophthora cactorum]KAG2832224.1 hypothetical protein PC111_g6677 [Phytophthora cactorum]KAG2860469.1 hypothetical protein PC113_g8020 [Phytophthora cactorum]KAG2889779.1 hypothetical protein PC115_g19653 [Phytophthora cactorum]
MYDSSIAKFTEWSDDSRIPMAEKVQTCNATREIVNNHYSPVVLPIGVLVVSVVAVTMLLLFQTTIVVVSIGGLVASVVSVTRLLSFQYAKDESTKGEMKSSNANMNHPMNAVESTKAGMDSTI